MADKFACPRCGAEQKPADVCKKCGVNIPKYIELKKARRAAPATSAETAPRQPRPERPSPQKQPTPQRAPVPPNPAPPKPPDAAPAQAAGAAPDKTPKPEPDSILEGTEPPQKERLSDVGELFRKTWEAYKRRV